jgi:hypothetical protein
LSTGILPIVTVHHGLLTVGGADSPAKLELSGALLGGFDAFRLTVSSDDFPVAPIAAFSPEFSPGCSGRATLRLVARGSLSRASLMRGSLEVEGEAGFDAAELRWRRHPQLITRIDGKVKFGRRTVSAEDLDVELFAARADPTRRVTAGTIRLESVRVEVDPPRGMSGSFDARAAVLEVDHLLHALRPAKRSSRARKPRDASRRRRPSLPKMSLTGRIGVDRAWAFSRRLMFSACEAECTLGDDRIDISNVAGKIWGGTLSGSASFELAGGAAARGEITGKDIDLARVCDSVSIPGTFVGHLGGTLAWRGSGLTREEFARTWALDIRAKSGPLRLQPGRFPLAREAKSAIERVLGMGDERGPLAAGPATLSVTLKRGRMSLESVTLEFENGLKTKMRGRAELDGRIAGWISIEKLPDARAAALEASRPDLLGLVGREALRFPVTGTWARPHVDAQALLWMLSGEGARRGKDEKAPGAPDAGSPEPGSE